MSAPAHRGEPDDLAGLTHSELLSHVRAWVQFRNRETSLRALAEEIGISKSSVDKFAAGQITPDKTWPKLRLWFLKDRREHGHSPHDAVTMALLLEQMVATIPQARRERAVRRIVEELAAIYHAAYTPVPGWLEALRPVPFPPQAGEEP